MLKCLAVYTIAGVIGLGLGGYTALAMSGLLPGDRRASAGIEINHWTGDLNQGSTDASPYLRARIARHGLLALAKSEAIYFIRDTDDDGEALSEECDYRMSGGPLPAGWWSVTLYNEENFLPNNTDEALSFDATSASGDSWSALISARKPTADTNWISSRNAGDFDLTLRLYMPEAEALERPKQIIQTPSIQKLNCDRKAS